MIQAALQKRLDRTESGEGGFTLVELLVVMIIIAILMAIAIPIFLSQKNKAVATGTKSDAKNLAEWLDSCSASDPSGTYSNCHSYTYATDEPGLAAAYGISAASGAGATDAFKHSTTTEVTMIGSGAAPAAAKLGAAHGVFVTTGPNSYAVSVSTKAMGVKAGSGVAVFTVEKDATGQKNVCGALSTGTTGDKQAAAQLCPAGTW